MIRANGRGSSFGIMLHDHIARSVESRKVKEVHTGG